MKEINLARWRLAGKARGAAVLLLSLLGYGHCGVRAASAAANEAAKDVGWPAYAGHVSGDHYSALAQINRSNVKRLKLAWTYDTGEGGTIETNPVIVGRTLYGYTASQKVIALDAATGVLKWKFDSGVKGTQPARGVVYMADGENGVIFAGIMEYLYKLDASTGKPITSFGENGRVDLRKNLRGDYLENSIALTTPGVVYKDLIIVGGRDPETLPAPPGDIRAYDVNTGALRWAFHTIPHPGEPGYDTWSKDSYEKVGAANDWAGMALDEKRGIAYIPTGSAAFDFYGGDRIGDNLYANSLLALNASTGKLIWFFQGVHHDLWDRDFPAHPVLLSIKHNGKMVDAVAQISKQGFLFVFDRTNGKPLFPIQEKPVPQTDVPGEVTSRTQPFPGGIEPFARQRLTEDLLTDRTPEMHTWAVDEFKKMRSDGQFTPLELARRTVIFPGFDGGGEWGGPAVDPAAGVIYINASDSPWTGGLETLQASGGPGGRIYRSQCGICHGQNRTGSGLDFPSLVGIGSRMTDGQIADQVHNGKGRMPAFPGMNDRQMRQLIAFLKTDPVAPNPPTAPPPPHEGSAPGVEHAPAPGTSGAPAAVGYDFAGYFKFEDPEGYPAVKPPWGTLNAIDLNTAKYLFRVTLGEYPDLMAKGLAPTGSENYGGPVVTAGGLVFIAATLYDRKLRAFDSKTGELLWEGLMPGSGIATPATYSVDGKQYIVVPTSVTRVPGSRHSVTPGGQPEFFSTYAYTYAGGGSYVAYALP
jgi:quinoprotein glucose dehydrogenase